MPKGYISALLATTGNRGTTEKIASANATKQMSGLLLKNCRGKKTNNFAQLWKKFLNSADYADLAPRTQKDYLAHEKYLLAVLAKRKQRLLGPEHVKGGIWMPGGKKSRVQANHEHSSMSQVFRWGYQRGYVRKSLALE